MNDTTGAKTGNRGALPTLLLTGFEAFGKLPENPSWLLAQQLDGETIERVQIHTAQLPVAWEESWPELHAAVERLRPSWVIMLGLAETRQKVTVEMRAKNIASPVKDNRAVIPGHEEVMPGSPEILNSSLPVTLMVERIAEAGVPVEVSSDAGAYLCNWTLYHALSWAEMHPEVRAVGFIHVPPLPEQGGPDIPLEALANGLRLAICSLVGGVMPSVEQLVGQTEEF